MSHSLQCQLNILKLKNLQSFHHLPAGEVLFIRCYISIGSGKRLRIETQEFPFQSFIDSISSSKPIKELLKKHNIVFELRVRKPKSLCSKFFTKSKLLGRAEVGWMDVLHNNGSSMEKWISFVMAPRFSADEKPPALLVRIEARVAEETKKRHLERHECDCEACQWVGSEKDVFLAAIAALDVVCS